MTRILFIFARLNPKVNYVQGMNEILAPILYIISTARPGPIQEAACFFMFNNVMSDLLDMHIKDFGNMAENPIHNKISSVSTMLLVKYSLLRLFTPRRGTNLNSSKWIHFSTLFVG